MVSGFFQKIGSPIVVQIYSLGEISILIFQTLSYWIRGKIEWSSVRDQIHRMGVKSLFLVSLIAIFTGMVLALQFIVGLSRFGLELYSGQVVGLAIVRELGPVLTALMVAARVGSGIAAELGSMTVTEQVMAIRAMGASPIIKLVVPRVLVTTLVTPLLTVFADLVGILGGLLVTMVEAGISPAFYYDQIVTTVELDDVFSGLSKTVFFGFSIGIICCYQGLKTTRGTVGVGRATTRSVVLSAATVFVLDYFLTKLFFMLF